MSNIVLIEDGETREVVIVPGWSHGEVLYERAVSLWSAAQRGDDVSVLALIDFYQEYPPPTHWRFRDSNSLIKRVNHFRSILKLPLFEVKNLCQESETQSEEPDPEIEKTCALATYSKEKMDKEEKVLTKAFWGIQPTTK